MNELKSEGICRNTLGHLYVSLGWAARKVNHSKVGVQNGQIQ